MGWKKDPSQSRKDAKKTDEGSGFTLVGLRSKTSLEVWASVGVCRFDLTQTDLDGHKRSFQPALTLQVLRRCLPAWIESSIRRRQNFIVRPRGAMLVQLDDLRGPVLERLKGCAFLMLATSPGNHQAWIA